MRGCPRSPFVRALTKALAERDSGMAKGAGLKFSKLKF